MILIGGGGRGDGNGRTESNLDNILRHQVDGITIIQ